MIGSDGDNESCTGEQGTEVGEMSKRERDREREERGEDRSLNTTLQLEVETAEAKSQSRSRSPGRARARARAVPIKRPQHSANSWCGAPVPRTNAAKKA